MKLRPSNYREAPLLLTPHSDITGPYPDNKFLKILTSIVAHGGLLFDLNELSVLKVVVLCLLALLSISEANYI